ncbi:retrovirus-related Pol polyprotein from transposon opus [Nephila pilipes]|uniref:Retrovirus-related Pol polyprotein from transposon opus n=1 Tax=Nephila pilipes TaxID=299642 RepID=A0A8X6P785_NEPPI|nr:retrovirus-related Pol polyprotein from transposon opus [Nephila pilipes]
MSPFQLLYGRQPEGPLSILKSNWTGKHNNLELCTTPVSKYLEEVKSKLERAAEEAKLVSEVQKENMAYYHNLRSSDRVFKGSDHVVVFISDSTMKLPNNSIKHIHQNKLRHNIASSNSINVIFEEKKEFGHVKTPPTATEESKFYEVLNNLKVDNLNSYQLKTLKTLISGACKNLAPTPGNRSSRYMDLAAGQVCRDKDLATRKRFDNARRGTRGERGNRVRKNVVKKERTMDEVFLKSN